jgi:AraC-like DNA-binding protein
VIDDPALAESLRSLFDCSMARPSRSNVTLALPARCGTYVPIMRPSRSRLNSRASIAAWRGPGLSRRNALVKIPLEVLARESGLSKFHLLRVFRDRTGLTPWQYQVNLRLDHARRLLQRGEPASQVADACGFVDQSHFTRIFRTVVGVTPAVYAASYRNPAR